MADGFGYGGSSRPYPYYLSPHPPASAPSFVADRSVESYDPIEGVSFTTSSYNQPPADWSYNPGYHQYLQPRSSSSSIYASNNSRSETYGFRGEDYYEDMFSPGGLFTSRESSSGCVSAVHPNENLLERKRTEFEPTYNSGTLIPGSSLAEEQTILHNVEPVNFDMLLGLIATENTERHSRLVQTPSSSLPPTSHPVECDIKSSSSLLSDKPEGSGHSLQCPRPMALFGDKGHDGFGIPLKNPSEAIKSDENKSWDYLLLSSLEGPSTQGFLSMESKSCSAVKTENLNAQSTFSQKTCFSGPTNRCCEDGFQAKQEPSITPEQICNEDIMNGNKKATFLTDLRPTERREDADDVLTGSPKRHLIDLGDFSSPASSPRISSVVNAMHNLSELLVYECFNNGSWLKLEQLESLEKVVNNLSKCLQKIAGNRLKPEEASNTKQPVHLSCSGMPILHEGPQVKPQERRDSCRLAEVLDKNEMTQSIKNILASNFPDDDKEQQPQTLLFKNLWLEAEAALCSTTYMARFQRIKNELGNQELQNHDYSADASPSTQEFSHKPQKSVHMMNNTEQETTESLDEHQINQGKNNVVTASHVPQSSDFNSGSMDALIEFISKSFTELSEQKTDTTSGKILNSGHQESPKSTTSNTASDIIERFQILKQQEANRRGRKAIHSLKIHSDSDKTVQSKHRGNSDQPIHDSQANPEASLMSTGSSEVDVMRRLLILKRRDAENDEQKPETGLDLESKVDSNNVVEPRFRPEAMASFCPYVPFMDRLKTEVVSGSGADELNEAEVHGLRGDESLTSDWEHVVKDEVVAGEKR